MRSKPFWLSIGLLIWLAATASAQPIASQDPQTPRFKIETDVVLVDLIATDEEGNFVADLKQEEVTLLERKKPQEITFFQLHAPPSAAPTGGRRASRGRQPPADGSQTRLVFLLDLPTLQPDVLGRVKESMRSFLPERMAAGDKAMLAVINHDHSIA